jgi:hypothetical protein
MKGEKMKRRKERRKVRHYKNQNNALGRETFFLIEVNYS